MQCKFCDRCCSCHISPPCSFCVDHVECDVCNQTVCIDCCEEVKNMQDGNTILICPDCYNAEID